MTDTELFYYTFCGKDYPARTISYWDENQIVSTIDLENKLLDDRDNYVSCKARCIDEQIFFFVDNDDIFKSEKEIQKIMFEAIGE